MQSRVQPRAARSTDSPCGEIYGTCCGRNHCCAGVDAGSRFSRSAGDSEAPAVEFGMGWRHHRWGLSRRLGGIFRAIPSVAALPHRRLPVAGRDSPPRSWNLGRLSGAQSFFGRGDGRAAYGFRFCVAVLDWSHNSSKVLDSRRLRTMLELRLQPMRIGRYMPRMRGEPEKTIGVCLAMEKVNQKKG